jgi:hypothetical protein
MSDSLFFALLLLAPVISITMVLVAISLLRRSVYGLIVALLVPIPDLALLINPAIDPSQINPLLVAQLVLLLSLALAWRSPASVPAEPGARR